MTIQSKAWEFVKETRGLRRPPPPPLESPADKEPRRTDGDPGCIWVAWSRSLRGTAALGATAFSQSPLSCPSRSFRGPIFKGSSGSRAVDRRANCDRLFRAESGPTSVVSGRTGVRDIAGIPLRVRNSLHRRPAHCARLGNHAVTQRARSCHQAQWAGYSLRFEPRPPVVDPPIPCNLH